jgi:hypothetical protein
MSVYSLAMLRTNPLAARGLLLPADESLLSRLISFWVMMALRTLQEVLPRLLLLLGLSTTSAAFPCCTSSMVIVFLFCHLMLTS